jgi:hypothetical protein
MLVCRTLKIIASVVFVLVAFSLPTSCTTSKLYKGPDLPEDEIAVIRTSATDYYGVFIRGTYFTAVDGVATDIFTNQVHVLPGSHSFNVKETTAAGCSARTEYGVIGFEAEAGHEYEILMGGANGSQGVFIWVEDLDTGEIVAGSKPS